MTTPDPKPHVVMVPITIPEWARAVAVQESGSPLFFRHDGDGTMPIEEWIESLEESR